MSVKKKFLSVFLAAAIITGLSAAAFASNPLPGAQQDNPVKKIVKDLSPAVVNIDVESVVTQSFRGFDDDPIFRRFFGEEFRRFSRSVPMKGRGSGFIVSKEGQVLTNNHVVEGANKITVTLSNGKIYSAKVVGRDPTFDLAIIKMESDEVFPVIEMGDSDEIEVGDWVIAIGNPYGLEHTVTVGVISAKNRSIHAQNVNFDGFLQTDAAINPGNSGGPLIGLDGKVVGINTAILPYAQGLGFAVPVNMAKQIMNDLVEFGSVKRGYLGVSVQNLNEEFKEAFELDVEDGIVIGDVLAGEAGEKAGLQRGDVVTHVNGEKVKNVQAFVNKIRSFSPKTKINLSLIREKVNMNVEIELGVMPGTDIAAEGMGQGKEMFDKLGMTVAPVNKELQKQYKIDIEKGLVVTKIAQGSDAHITGLSEGDVIFEVNNVRVNSIDDLNKAVSGKKSLALLVWRDGRTFYVPMKMPK
ncbi:MAG: Do family serine endopeptidase [Synergistaceae bacterium]|nr:Do family serine endopeptidase [Synergistaceae bacterium]